MDDIMANVNTDIDILLAGIKDDIKEINPKQAQPNKDGTPKAPNKWTFDNVRNVVTFAIVIAGIVGAWGATQQRVVVLEQKLEYVKLELNSAITLLQQEVSKLNKEIQNTYNRVKELEDRGKK